MHRITIKNQREIERMRQSGKAAAHVLHRIAAAIQPGVSTAELEQVAKEATAAVNAIPSFLNYKIPQHPPYPARICVSRNDVVIHGIPNKAEKLRSGDIIGVDTAVKLGGYHGDNAFTFAVGDVSHEAQRLLDVTKASLYAAIAEAKPGNRVGDIASQLQNVAESAGFSVIQNYAGHGIGRHLHEKPELPCFGTPGRGPRLRTGMVLAIEAMVNAGGSDVECLADGWTIATTDSSLSAFFEHTVAVLPDGPEILTESPIWEQDFQDFQD